MISSSKSMRDSRSPAKVHNLALLPRTFDGQMSHLSGLMDRVARLGELEVDGDLAGEWMGADLKRIHVYVTDEFDETDLELFGGMLRSEPVKRRPSDFEVVVACPPGSAKESALRWYCRMLSLAPECTVKLEQSFFGAAAGEPELGFLGMYYDIKAVSERMEAGPHGFIPEALRNDVATNGIVPEKFWYWDEESATLWHKLCLPTSGYKLVEKTTGLLERNADSIVEQVLKANSGSQALDFVDLGVGTPKKDLIILEAIAHQCRPDSEIKYYPIDISFPLLELTLRRVLPLKEDLQRPEENNIGISVHPLIGDIERLQDAKYQALLASPKPRLFALLGNTLGNLTEERMFRALAAIMVESDFLLVDAEFMDNTDPAEVVAQYQTQAMYDFVYHPLYLLEDTLQELAGKTLQDGMRVESIPARSVKFRFWPRDERNRKTRDLHHQTHQITDVRDSQVIAMFHQEDKQGRLLMAWSTKYERKAFEQFVGELFRIENTWWDGRYGLYLLRPKPGSR